MQVPMLGAWIGAQGPTHANLQSVMVSRFFDQGGEVFFPSLGIDSYFNFFHTFANSNIMVARALAQPTSEYRIQR
jgi:hypothetical protein